jgi:hypothetical protein
VLPQDTLHRVPGDLMSEVGESSAYPRVSPFRVLLGHPDNEFCYLARSLWPTPPSPGAPVILLRDQLAVPAQDRVRGGDAGESGKHFAPEPLAAHRKPLALGVGEADSLAVKLLPEYPVLLAQVVDRVFLLAVEPARRNQNKEL